MTSVLLLVLAPFVAAAEDERDSDVLPASLASTPQAAAALRAGYPHFRGATGSGAALESGLQLVTDLVHPRLAWCSELRRPDDIAGTVEWSVQVYPPWPMNCVNNGGFSSPVVVGDRVYIAWSQSPSQGIGQGDDAVACIDLLSGRTIWQTIFAGTGINLRQAKMNDGQLTPCVADGKVFFLGSLGGRYCVDADTGDKLWGTVSQRILDQAEMHGQALAGGQIGPHDPVPWEDAIGRRIRQQQLRQPHELGGSGGGNWNATPVLAGDTVVFGSKRSCIGVAKATGAVRWRHDNVLNSTTSPVLWRHQGVERIVCYSRRLTCLDPASGEILWQRPNVGGSYQGHTPPIYGDLLICTGRDAQGRKSSMRGTCFRLTPDGPEELWRLPDGVKSGYRSPVIYRDRVYFNADLDAAYIPSDCGFAMPRTGRGKALYCVDLASGELLGVGNIANACSSLLAMDGRISFTTGTTHYLWDAEPTPERGLTRLGKRRGHTADSTTETGAAGFLLRAGVGHMVTCWDLRAEPPAAPPPTETLDPANGAWQLDLDDALADRRDLRLHLVLDEGRVVQSWASMDDHVQPELAWADELRYADGRLYGELRCWLSSTIVDYHGKFRHGGRHYRFAIDVRVDGASLAGGYEEQVIERTHFAHVHGHNRHVRVRDEHHVEPTSGSLSGCLAADIDRLGRGVYDRRLRDELVAVQQLKHGDLEGNRRWSIEGCAPVVRRAAIDHLARAISWREHEEYFAAIDDRARNDPELSVRLCAIRSLVHHGTVYPMLERLLEDEEPIIVATALTAISRVREKTRSPYSDILADRLVDLVGHPDQRVRSGALNALGWAGVEVLPRLADLMGSDLDEDGLEEWLRAADRATRRVKVIPKDDRETMRRAILTALVRDGLEAAAVEDGLRCLGKTGSGALPALVRLSRVGQEDQLRLAALTLIAEHGRQAGEYLDDLVDIIEQSVDARIRRRAIVALGVACDRQFRDAPPLDLGPEIVDAILDLSRKGSPEGSPSVVYRNGRLLALVFDQHEERILAAFEQADRNQAESFAVMLRYLDQETAREHFPLLQALGKRLESEGFYESIALTAQTLELQPVKR